MSAHGLAEGLLGFIAGVAAASVLCWTFRGQITAWMIRRRNG